MFSFFDALQRCLHRAGPLYLNSKFVLSISMHKDQPKSRGSMRVALHRCPKTNMYHSSFEFQGASLYIQSPSRLNNKECISVSTGKTQSSVNQLVLFLLFLFSLYSIFSVHVQLFVLLWQDQYEKPPCVCGYCIPALTK